MSRTRVVIFGTGGLATLFGARLGRQGFPVTLVGSWQDALDAIPRTGLTIVEDGASWSVSAQVADIRSSLPPGDIVLALVKSHQTSRIATRLAASAPEGVIATLQNGLGNREALESVTGRRVIQGVTTAGATLLRPGVVRAFPGRIALGSEPGLEASVDLVASALRRAGFDVGVTDDIEVVLWRKLAINCAINPLSALMGIANGVLLEKEETRTLLIAAAREVGAVASARGIGIGDDPAALAIEVARRTGENRSSMLQDMDRGSPTEIDALCGAVVREGQRLGVPTPVNRRLWDDVRRLEGRPAASGSDPAPEGLTMAPAGASTVEDTP